MSRNEYHDFYAYWDKTRQFAMPREEEIHKILRQENKSEAVEQLILQSLQFVCRQVYSWKNFAYKHNIDLLDLVGAGNIGLIKGVNTYSCSGWNFYKYVGKVIRAYIFNQVFAHFGFSRSECLKRMKLHMELNPVDSFDTVISDNGEDEPMLLEEIIPCNGDKTEQLTLDVNNLLTTLRKDHRAPHKLSSDVIELRYAVCSRRYNKPLSLSETAKLLQPRLSKEGIRKIERKTLVYLRSL